MKSVRFYKMASTHPGIFKLDPLTAKYVSLFISIDIPDSDTSSVGGSDDNGVDILAMYTDHLLARNRPSNAFLDPPTDPFQELQSHVFKEQCRFFPEHLFDICQLLSITVDVRGYIVTESKCVAHLRIAVFIVLSRHSSPTTWNALSQQVSWCSHLHTN